MVLDNQNSPTSIGWGGSTGDKIKWKSLTLTPGIQPLKSTRGGFSTLVLVGIYICAAGKLKVHPKLYQVSQNLTHFYTRNQHDFQNFRKILKNFTSNSWNFGCFETNVSKFWKMTTLLYQFFDYKKDIVIPGGWFCIPFQRHIPIHLCIKNPPGIQLA